MRHHSFLYYLNPFSITAEAEEYGEKLSLTYTLLTIFLFGVYMIGGGIFLKANVRTILIGLGTGLYFIPAILRCSLRRKYEKNRFYDVAQYLDELLYNFKISQKINTALRDVAELFQNEKMGQILEKAIVIVEQSSSVDANRQGLDVIEKEYPCDKIRNIHDFILMVEEHGGNYDTMIDLLQEDRKLWHNRQMKFQRDVFMYRLQNIVALGITLLLCVMLGQINVAGLNITSYPIYQFGVGAILIFDAFFFLNSEKKTVIDWLQTKNEIPDEKSLGWYECVVHYNKKNAFMERIKFIWIPCIFLFLGVFFSQIIFFIMAALICLYLLVDSPVYYFLAKKSLSAEVIRRYPQWLMGLALRLQQTTVQRAIFDSIESAPAVLVPELKLMQERLEENPLSITPYLQFYSICGDQDIRSSMKMLYSLSVGGGADPEEQIAEIIHRNNARLDQVETAAQDSTFAKMATLSLAPNLTAGAYMFLLLVLMMFSFMQLVQI